MTPLEILSGWARSQPDKTAFIANQDVWTFGRLAQESERLAAALVAHGVGAGDRVALHMNSVPEILVAYYACFHLGAIAAPLNVRMKTAELRPLLERLRPALYLGQDELYGRIDDIETEILPANARFIVGAAEGMAQPWGHLFADVAPKVLLARCDAAAPAVLLTTSGTTGQSKFVVHSQSTLSAIVAVSPDIGLDSGQIVIHALPMVHAAGLWMLLGAFRCGAPVILLNRFDPDAVLDAIEAHRGSFMLGSPFMFTEMLQRQTARARDVASLRQVLVAGDACPPELHRTFHEAFRAPLRSVWAATETGFFGHGQEPEPFTRVPQNMEISLVDDNGAQVPHGEAGEMLVKGPGVSAGYWIGPGQIDSASEDGWYRTGDLMCQATESELWFVSRKKELIIRGGSNISPVEVEQVLLDHPTVRDAAVLGVADPTLGQRVAALVQLATNANDADLSDIRDHVRAHLADYKVPEWMQVVNAIPRNALGKIERRALMDLLETNE